MEEEDDSNNKSRRNLAPQSRRLRGRNHYHHNHNHQHHHLVPSYNNYHNHQYPFHNLHHNPNNYRLIGFLNHNNHQQQQQQQQNYTGLLPLPPILPFQVPLHQNQRFRAKTHFPISSPKPHKNPPPVLPPFSDNDTKVQPSDLQGEYSLFFCYCREENGSLPFSRYLNNWIWVWRK